MKATLSGGGTRKSETPITLTTSNDTTTDSDYSALPATLSIVAGRVAGTATLTVAPVDDSIDEDDETLKLMAATAVPGFQTPQHVIITITDDDEAGVTVTPNELTVLEGRSESYTVVLKTQPSADVEVTVSGHADTDVNLDKTTLTFTSENWDTAQTVKVTAAEDDDAADDDDVTLAHAVTSTDSLYDGATASSVTVSITEKDTSGVTVNPTSLTVREGDTDGASYTVVLDTQPSADVEVTVSGHANTDVNLDKTTLTFTTDTWDTAQSVKVTAAEDDDADTDADVTLSHAVTSTDSLYEGATSNSVKVTIIEVDDPQVTVSFEQGSYTVAEGSSVTVKVKLSADPEREVVIPITKADQGGATAADYSEVPTSLTFQSGDTEQSFTFTAEPDTVDDDGESVKLTFGTLPAGVTEGTTKEATVAITDDDVPSVSVMFEQSSYTVAESDDSATPGVEENKATIKVSLSADPEREVVIPLSTNDQGGATAADYSGVPTSLTFQSGDTEKSFTFTAEPDSVDDDGESVKLTFGTLPTGVSEGTTKEATVAITDDDVPSVSVMFEQSSYTVAESDDSATPGVEENKATIKVALSADPEREVVIPLSTANQDGATDADYSGVPTSLTFQSGDTEKSFTFTAEPDTVDDDGESVKLAFGTLPTGVSEGTTGEATVNITDDDVPQVTVSFEQSSYAVAESDDSATPGVEENKATIKVTLSADPEREVVILLSATNEGGATGDDYSGVPANVTFQSGDTEKSFTFTAEADSDNDDGESVKLTFGTLPTGVSEGTTKEATVAINDDDVPSVAVSFEKDAYTVAEGSNVTVKVKLSADPEREVVILLSATNEGGATGDDYSGVPANVTFQSGDTEKSFTFTAEADSDNDDGESVKLTFGTLPAGVSEGTTKEATVAITDDDVPSVAVSFERSSYTVAEGSDVTVKVKLSADPEREVVIPLSTTDQGGASSSDYSGVPANVTFQSGDTEKSFTFTAEADDLDDDGESVKLSFGTLPTGVSEGTTGEATVNITDDDVPSVTVSFERSSYTVAEGSDVTVKVKLSADPEREVVIPLSATDEGGATGDDYSGVPASLIFQSGDTEKSFTFTAEADSDNDDGESVKLTFGTLPTGVSEGATKEATVAITDDDVPSVTVSFEEGSYTVAEGSNVTVKVKLSADPEREVVVPLTATDQGGATAADYSGVPAEVTFQSGDTEKSFTFTAEADSDNDDGESVKLTFGTLPAGVSEGTTKEATVSITGITVTGDSDYCGDAIWCAELKLAEWAHPEEGMPPLYIYHSMNPESSLSEDRFTYQGEDFTFINMDINVLPEELFYRSPYAVLGRSTFSIAMASGGEDWYTARGPVHEEYYRDWVLYFEDLALPFRDAQVGLYNTHFLWMDAEWSVFDNSGHDGAGTYRLRIEERQLPEDDADTKPPEVVEATIRGDVLTMTFDEELDDQVMPSDRVFYVTFQSIREPASEPPRREIRKVSITGKQLVLTLDRPVVWDEFVVLHCLDLPWGSYIPIKDLAGNKAEPLESFVVTNLMPASPRYLEVSPGESGELRASWYPPFQDKGSPPTGYKVQWKEASGSWDTPSDVSEQNVAGTTHTITGLTNGVLYSIRVIGVHAEGDGHPSDEATGTPTDGDSQQNVDPQNAPGSDAALTAKFQDNPEGHNGADAFTVRIAFSEEIDISVDDMRDHALIVSGATISSVSKVDDRSDLWEVTLQPSGDDPVALVIAPTTDCAADGAICTGDGRPLSDGLAVVIPKSEPVQNSPATGLPIISGTARAGETLTVSVSEISDEDGMIKASFGYWWFRVDGGEETLIEDDDGARYTLTGDDVGKTIRVRVKFTDDASNVETLDSEPTAMVEPRMLTASFQGQPASHDGQNAFTFELRFSEEVELGDLTLKDHALTVTGGEVTGASRLEAPSNIRWQVTVEPDSDDGVTVVLPVTTDCSAQGAVCTGGGRKLSAEVSVSVPGPAPQQQPQNSEATGAPAISGTLRVGETLTASTAGIADADGMENASFSYQWMRGDGNAHTDLDGETGRTYELSGGDQGKIIRVRVSFRDDADNEESLTSAATSEVEPRPNSEPTGAPTISGTVRVGETLTASTSGIADADGLDNVSFSYQWMRGDGNAHTDIAGETARTYELSGGDVGRTIKVRVSFRDDANNEETVTSAATGAVAPRPPLTASFQGQPSSHDGQADFTFELRFSEELPVSYLTLRDHAFTVTGGTVGKAQRLTQGSNIGWRITVTPDSNADVTVVLPATTDCDATGAVCTGDGRKLSNRNEFTVSGL